MDQYIRKQDGIHLSGIHMVGLSGIQMAFKNQIILHSTSLQPLEYQTRSLFRFPLYSYFFLLMHYIAAFYRVCKYNCVSVIHIMQRYPAVLIP